MAATSTTIKPPFPVLFEDNHIIVIEKPAGLLTQPTDLESDSALNRLKDWIKIAKEKPGNVFLEPIHRIDKPVSGIVVFAKTSKALSRLMQAVRDKKTTKEYLALVEKKPPKAEGVLKHFHSHGDYKAILSKEPHPDSKEATLDYKVLKKHGPYFLLQIELDTGRYHQIRAQLAEIGSPIVGDSKYGSLKPYQDKAIALHHFRMKIPHPTTNEELTLTSYPSFAEI